MGCWWWGSREKRLTRPHQKPDAEYVEGIVTPPTQLSRTDSVCHSLQTGCTTKGPLDCLPPFHTTLELFRKGGSRLSTCKSNLHAIQCKVYLESRCGHGISTPNLFIILLPSSSTTKKSEHVSNLCLQRFIKKTKYTYWSWGNDSGQALQIPPDMHSAGLPSCLLQAYQRCFSLSEWKDPGLERIVTNLVCSHKQLIFLLLNKNQKWQFVKTRKHKILDSV